MAKQDPYLAHLATVPLFGDCSERELAMIARRGTDVVVPAGRILVREGRPGYEFFVIIDGTVTVTRDGEHVTDLGPGAFFGELALLHDVPRNATVAATTEVEILVVQSQELRTLLTEVPNLARALRSEGTGRTDGNDSSAP